MSAGITPSQTVGPFFLIGTAELIRTEIARPGMPGERVTVAGRVLDGDGAPVNDALVEIWQADAEGRYATAPGAGFQGFGRAATDDNGAFRFSTIKPGRVPGAGGRLQAPHLAVIVFMRGLLKHLVTRVYFPDDPANGDDPLLQSVPAERRGTLIAAPTGEPGALAWNVILQGKDETVFLDY